MAKLSYRFVTNFRIRKHLLGTYNHVKEIIYVTTQF